MKETVRGGRAMIDEALIIEELLEKLAALEHEQWAHWTKYMLDHLTEENKTKWQRQIQTPYNKLSETEKESDRAWARKALAIMEGAR